MAAGYTMVTIAAIALAFGIFRCDEETPQALDESSTLVWNFVVQHSIGNFR